MLVIISDLHLTDGSSGETIRAGAFQTFKERLLELACDASWRSDEKYVPIKGIDLVLLGDILDVIRAKRWWNGSPRIRPWSDPSDPEFTKTIACITDDILEKNRDSLDILRSLHDLKVADAHPSDAASSAGTDLPGASGGARVHIPVRIHYLVGNHDWFYHLKGPAYDAIRRRIVQAIGLENDPGIIFPHDPDESPLIQQIYREHRVFARHGDIFDSSNFEHDRDESSLGDAIVIELLDRFALEVARISGIPEACRAGLREIDNVRPQSMIPVWVDGLVRKTCTPGDALEVKRIWNEIVQEFLKLDFVTKRPFESSVKIKLQFEISSEVSLAGLGDVLTWLGTRTGGRRESYSAYALHEKAFSDGWARFIVYGHTHYHEIVPLRSLQQGEQTIETLYINSGTWRPVHELAQFHPLDKQFVRYQVMTYLSFFKDDERKGRQFEVWSGALGSSTW